MHVSVRWSALKESRWNECAVRFAFGGLATALAGYVATKYGPAVGGLFLAFPAIFPASATLVEKHEKQKKEKEGLHGEQRGIDAAGVDAVGAALGSIGLVGFGAVVWLLGAKLSVIPLLGIALTVWAVISFVLWMIRQRV